jgi:hypothetical protein
VVAVLFAASRVATGGLQVTARVDGDPYVGPCRGDGNPGYSGEHSFVVDDASLGVHVKKRRRVRDNHWIVLDAA